MRGLDELIDRINDGDVNAAEQVCRTYEPYLRMVVRRRLCGPLRSKLDSADVVQSIWADVLRGFPRAGWNFADRAQLRAFLVRMVCNRLIDRQRQHRRALAHEQPLDHAVAQDLAGSNQARPSEVAQGSELWERMLAICPAAHREILHLKRQGLPLAEIAVRSGLHAGTVRRILYDVARRLAATQPQRCYDHSTAVS
jgi:RNA polymerase sigma factor (sigma-70 family)